MTSNSSNEIKPGTIVLIHGLHKDTSLNGTKGLCMCFVAHCERFKVKLISGDTKHIKSDNLRLDDDLVEFVCSPIPPYLQSVISNAQQATDMRDILNVGDIGHCQVFADLVTALYGNNILDFATDGTPCLQTLDLKGRSIYQVNSPAVGHSFIVEFIECGDGSVHSRIFHAFRNNFTVKEWLSQIEWMNNNQTKCFFRNLALLKVKVDTFIVEELLESLTIPEGTSPVEFSKTHFTNLMKESTQYGDGPYTIGMQPSKWDKASLSKYKQERGGLTIRSVDCKCDFALCYRVKPWAEILYLHESLFHAVNPDFSLYALSQQGPLAWTWRKILHQDQYK